MEYCRWPSAKTGKVDRLLTEAEWEQAGRAGITGPYSFPTDEIDDCARYVENAEKPMKVGRKKPNPRGLHDIHGNVAEWCPDHDAADNDKTCAGEQPAVGSVVLPDAKEFPCVVRSGSRGDDPELLRSAARRSSDLDRSPRTCSGPGASGGTQTPPPPASASRGRRPSRRTCGA